ncbi:MAG: NAD(P)-binding domain-containing protein [Candidatus Sericytochromatia bacterium]|nr:NAD(P)-binding domain-containing protein [Candidatus Sericytochromatia bacterium]
MDTTDKHLIIGAGFCGLGVAAALQRHGIPFDIVEAADDLGGNWYHGVYETVHIISSRRTTAFPDFPMPADWPDFPSAGQMLTYLRRFAEDRKLRRHIRFDTRIVAVSPEADDRWAVTDAMGATRIYGGVVVCNGHHWDMRMPHYPGTFTGELIHAKQYKRTEQLRGRRVLVIGGGNSACDIAAEAARSGASAHISLRRGYWFLPKTMAGIPTVEFMPAWLPLWLQRPVLRLMIRLVVGRYEDYGLPHPDHAPFEHHPTINTELLYYLRQGTLSPHPDIQAYDGRTVTFVDGQTAEIDLIVAATGYNVSFPFLAEGVVTWVDGMPQLIGGVLPPDRKHLYVFGLGQPRYGAGPLIAAGAEFLAGLIAIQRQLRHPVGAVLRRLGAKAPTTWLADPHRSLRDSRRGLQLLPWLPKLESWLMAKGG